MKAGKTKFVGFGGFLGAGKTTTLKTISKYYKSKGLNVAVITNDAAENLVDTMNVAWDNNIVEEVVGGCFCCEFDQLTDTIKNLKRENIDLDVIIAEPVGSCTDLVATVVQPLKDLYEDELEVTPFMTLIDPIRAKTIFLEEDHLLSEKVVYIIKKQLEESDAILLNKIDRLTKEEKTELAAVLKELFNKEVIAFSAKTGEGLEDVIRYQSTAKQYGRNITEVDYDIYAEGEALLGWLNANVFLKSKEDMDVNNILLDFIDGMKKQFSDIDVEPAHLKISMIADKELCVANLVSNVEDPVLSNPVTSRIKDGQLVVNARVEADPEVLREKVMSNIKRVSEKFDLYFKITDIASFKPARPVPVHRYSAPV